MLLLADACKSLGVKRVYGDKYAMGWTDALFRQAGLTYEPSPLTKSEIYLGMLALINSGQVSLPNESRLVSQLMGLVRRPSAAGRESVDHAARAGAHDDVANAARGRLGHAGHDAAGVPGMVMRWFPRLLRSVVPPPPPPSPSRVSPVGWYGDQWLSDAERAEKWRRHAERQQAEARAEAEQRRLAAEALQRELDRSPLPMRCVFPPSDPAQHGGLAGLFAHIHDLTRRP